MDGKFIGVAVAALIVVSGNWGAGLAAAQTPITSRGNLVVREDLKGPGPTADRKALAARGGRMANDPAVLLCNQSDVCQSSLLVSRGGYVEVAKDTFKWDPQSCSVYWPYYQIKITNGSQPTLRWVLVKDATDDTLYQFDVVKGIDFSTDDALFENDPRKDLYQNRRDKSGTAFTWRNLNLRSGTKTLKFYPVVYLMEGGKRVDCNVADPEVVNEN